MVRQPPRSTQSRSSAASDVYKRQEPINDVVVKIDQRGNPVRVRDVGVLSDSSDIQTNVVRTDGKRSVYLRVNKQPIANTVEVVDALRKAIPKMIGIPPGVQLGISFDQSIYIRQSIKNLIEQALHGSLLAAAVIAVPLSKAVGLGSIIGYLAAGIAIGPWGLGLVTNVEDILHFAEFGVVLMLFLVGLELEPKRLWSLRRPIFGWGSAQVLGCAAALAGVAVALGVAWPTAVVAAPGVAVLLPAGTARGDGGPVFQVPTATPTSRPTRTPTPRIPRLAPTATPSPTPATYRRVVPGVSNEALPTSTAGTAADLSGLRQSLSTAINKFPVSGAYAIAVTDLQSGASVDVHGDRYPLSGCIMNLFVLMSTMLDVQQGAYPLDDVSEVIAATIWSSNTATARALYRKTGGNDLGTGLRKVGRLMNERMGMEGTLIDHPPGYPAETLGRDPNNWISANDTNRGLTALWNGSILHDPYRVYLLDAMVQVSPTLNYLLAYNPHGRVGHKNGWLFEDGGWVDNDSGIVRFVKDGREYAYAITFMSQDVEQFKAEVPLGQQLARITWDWFNAAYP